MSIGESVGQISVLELPTMNDPKPHIEVLVVDVFTPSFFWIQLRKNKKTFDKLMNDINAFYIANEESYKIPLIVLEKGLNCACKYGNVWHRAIIKNVGHDYKVTLMFYDYGTIKTYEASEVCYLHRQFSYIPAQAIPASLINIKPCNGTVWSRGVTHEFAERVSHAPLIATIAKVDEESNSALITLTDTTEEDDVHINDWLVEQKFAVYGKMVRMRPKNFAFRYDLECQQARLFKQAHDATSTSISNIINNNKQMCDKAGLAQDCHIIKTKHKHKFSETLLHRLQTDKNRNKSDLDKHFDLRNNISDTENTSINDSATSKPIANVGLRSLYNKFKTCQVNLTKNNLSISNNLPSNNTVNTDCSSSINTAETKNKTQRMPLSRDKKKLYERISKLNSKSNIKDNITDSSSNTEAKTTSDEKENENSYYNTNLAESPQEKLQDQQSSGLVMNLYDTCFSPRDSDCEDGKNDKFFGNFHSLYGGQGNTKKIDWSAINNDMQDQKLISGCKDSKLEQKESVITSGKINVLTENSIFLNAVRLSCSSRDDTFWSPSGNINNTPNDFTLLSRRRKKFDKDVSVAISRRVFNALQEIPSSDSFSSSVAIDSVTNSEDGFYACKQTSNHKFTDVLSGSSNCKLNEKDTSYKEEIDNSRIESSTKFENFIEIHKEPSISKSSNERLDEKQFTKNQDERQNHFNASFEMQSLCSKSTLKTMLLKKLESLTAMEDECDELDSDDSISLAEYSNGEPETELIKTISEKRFDNISTFCNQKQSDLAIAPINIEDTQTDISDNTSTISKYDEFSTSAKDTYDSEEFYESVDKQDKEIIDIKKSINKQEEYRQQRLPIKKDSDNEKKEAYEKREECVKETKDEEEDKEGLIEKRSDQTKETINKQEEYEIKELIEKELDHVQIIVSNEDKCKSVESENKKKYDSSEERVHMSKEEVKVPTFCDINIESDDEEWDVYEGDFVGKISQFINYCREKSGAFCNVDNSDTGVQITEISESDKNEINSVVKN